MRPLTGTRVLEVEGIGPSPFAGMMLADMGADVIRLERPASRERPGPQLLHRGRTIVIADIKDVESRARVLDLVQAADVLLEGFRPGVMERLGLGPDVCLACNPRLVYARMTGWGQDGPLAQEAGHDINYIAIAGVLNNLRRPGERPLAPLNLVGDFGGGGMILAYGIVCALLERHRSGRGQVIDAAMVDGVALLMTMIYGFVAQGRWDGDPGTNLLDSGAPFYEVYETLDGRYVAVGAIEERFYAELLNGLEIDPATVPPQMHRSQWPTTKARFAARFRTRTRDEWTEVFASRDACVSPVLSMEEAARHPHMAARATFTECDGGRQPNPAPRLDRTPAARSGTQTCSLSEAARRWAQPG